MPKYKITQEHDKCIGCSTCVSLCPSNWKVGSDGKSRPKKTTDSAECNLKAEKHCPVKCIHVRKIKK